MRILALSLLLGCGSVTTYQSAEALPRGEWQGMAALGAGVFTDKPQQSHTPTANLELGARRGVGDATDVGLKLYTLGIEASIREQLTAGRWSWALLGALGGTRSSNRSSSAIPNALLGQVKLGAVATRRTSGTFAWSIGPIATGSVFVPEGGGGAVGALLGGFVNLDWRFAARWHLVPELSWHWTIAGDVPVDGNVGQLGVAFARDF